MIKSKSNIHQALAIKQAQYMNLLTFDQPCANIFLYFTNRMCSSLDLHCPPKSPVLKT